jgi:RNA polymerase sigma factor (sigma-70 family)
VSSVYALDLLARELLARGDDGPRYSGARFKRVPGDESRLAERVASADSLTARIRAGDAAAFTEIIRVHYDALVRFAASLLTVRADAEDLVQDVLARVWKGRARLDPRRAFHTYLFTSVRNSALNHRRDERTAQRYVQQHVAAIETSDSAAVLPPDQQLDVAAAAEDDARRVRALADALAGLPERTRTALLLRFEQRMTHAEVGSVLGMSEKAAQQVILRAIARLRGLLLPGG